MKNNGAPATLSDVIAVADLPDSRALVEIFTSTDAIDHIACSTDNSMPRLLIYRLICAFLCGEVWQHPSYTLMSNGVAIVSGYYVVVNRTKEAITIFGRLDLCYPKDKFNLLSLLVSEINDRKLAPAPVEYADNTIYMNGVSLRGNGVDIRIPLAELAPDDWEIFL